MGLGRVSIMLKNNLTPEQQNGRKECLTKLLNKVERKQAERLERQYGRLFTAEEIIRRLGALNQ